MDGAALSLLDHGFRVPVGSSDGMATHAERLQFIQGEGPCLDAARAHQLVVAAADEIERRWPAFGAEFLEHTPYRGVVSLPVRLSGHFLHHEHAFQAQVSCATCGDVVQRPDVQVLPSG